MADSEYRHILRQRMLTAGGATSVPTTGLRTSGPRVQKNLSLLQSDAARMAALARRDQRSQARLIAAALDCYENTFGPLAELPEA